MSESPPTSPAATEAEVQRIRALLKQQQFADAVDAAGALRARFPENRDVLYVLALGLRQLRRLPEALAVLADMERHHPRSSLLYQERGHCYVAQRDAPRAIEAYEHAVRLNPALPATWGMLEGLYRMVGDNGKREVAELHSQKLKTMPPEVVTATGLFCEGDLSAAERLVRAYLVQQGNHVEAMRLLARIGVARDVLDDAEVLLAAAVELAPDYIELRRDYACVLIDRHKHSEALVQLEKLLLTDPGSNDYRTLHATATISLGHHEAGMRGFEAVLQDTDPASRAAADLHLSIAHSLKTLGRRDEAIERYRQAIAVRPRFGDAYWSLANLKTYRFSDEEIDRLRTAEADPDLATIDRYHLCFALGKAFEDRRDYATSWQYYERGNALKRAESKYRAELLEQNTAHQIATCTREFFDARKGWGCPDPAPIFILGLPRAGSTLLEQILASHSSVEGTQELAIVPRTALELQGYNPDFTNPRYPRCLADMSAEDFRALGERYLDEAAVFRGSKPFFIDKMPNNFRHVGLIHLMLPNAKIIDARREPMACCFGNLKQLFARGQEFCYSIDDIARYYRTYLELMAHWDTALPTGRVLRVHHEDVVEDLEGSVHRILDYLGLPFETACLEYHKNVRSVRTASSEQVRQPIYREGLDQWRHYEPWLEPLREALGDALTRYRD